MYSYRARFLILLATNFKTGMMEEFDDFKKQIEEIIGGEKRTGNKATSVAEANKRLANINDPDKLERINNYMNEYILKHNLNKEQIAILSGIVNKSIFEAINL